MVSDYLHCSTVNRYNCNRVVSKKVTALKNTSFASVGRHISMTCAYNTTNSVKIMKRYVSVLKFMVMAGQGSSQLSHEQMTYLNTIFGF